MVSWLNDARRQRMRTSGAATLDHDGSEHVAPPNARTFEPTRLRDDAPDSLPDVRPADRGTWAGLAVVGLGGFALLAWLVASGTTIPFDQPLLDAAKGLGPYMEAWRGLSDAANLPMIAVGTALVTGLILARRLREAIVVVLILVAATAGSEAVKQLVARPRPPGFAESDLGVVYSFPSGHVLEAVAILGMISILMWHGPLPRPAQVAIPLVFALIVILVAIARVAVAAHYPSDVLAGLLAGLGCVAVFALATDIFGRRRAAPSA